MEKDKRISVKRFLYSNRGAGIKEIAVALGAIVVVGLVITAVKGDLLTTWLKDIWSWVTSFIKDNVTK